MKTITIIAQMPRITFPDNGEAALGGFLKLAEKVLPPALDSKTNPLHTWQLSLSDGLSRLPKLSEIAMRSGIRLAILITDEKPEWSILPRND